MKEIFEKARSLAIDLLDTEQGKKYTSARAEFDADSKAVVMLHDYGKKVQVFQGQIQSGVSIDDLQSEKAELDELILIMQENTVISNLFRTEGEFHQTVSTVMDVFNATIIGDVPDMYGGCGCGSEGGCCGGGGGGCGTSANNNTSSDCGCNTPSCTCGDNCECTPENNCGCGGVKSSASDCGCGDVSCDCDDNCECTQESNCGCNCC